MKRARIFWAVRLKRLRAWPAVMFGGAALGLTCAPAAALAVPQTRASIQRVYVAPDAAGSRCTRRAPCALPTAQSVVRHVLARDRRDARKLPIAVQLGGGIYRLTRPLRFDAVDSGTPGAPVLWTAAREARPVLSGSVRITGWKRVDRANNVWAATVPAGAAATRLYVDGRPAPIDEQSVASLGLDLTRWTAAGGFTLAGRTRAFFAGVVAGRTDAALKAVRLVWNPMPPTDWAESECPVAALAGNQLRMAEPCWNNLTNKSETVYGGNASNVTPFNLKPGSAPTAMVDTYNPVTRANPPAPGHWYLAAAAQRLYYVPMPGQRMAALDVELPRLESLLQVSGTLSRPVSNLVFRGLTFEGTTWAQPASGVGFVQVQANLDVTQPAVVRGGALQPATQGECRFAVPVAGSCPWAAFREPPAAVALSAARDVVFRGDTFRDLGAIGLKLAYGSRDNRVQGNTFNHVASSAIWLGCSADPDPGTADDSMRVIAAACAIDPVRALADDRGVEPAREIMRDNVVADNLIHHVGYGYAGAAGITLLFTRHTTIAHNVLFDLPYDGITSGAWQGHPNVPHDGESIAQYYNTTTNINADNAIVDNVFHQVMQAYGDGGAIYTEGQQGPTRHERSGAIDYAASFATGLVIRGNVSDNDSRNKQYFIAPDVGSQWITVTGNVEWNAPASGRQYSMSSHWPKSPAAVYTSTHGNWFADPDDTPDSPGLGANHRLATTPGAADLPLAVLRGAGLEAGYRVLARALPPAVYYVHRSARCVFVAGEGLTRSTMMRVDGRWVALQPLSPEFAIAVLPGGPVRDQRRAAAHARGRCGRD